MYQASKISLINNPEKTSASLRAHQRYIKDALATPAQHELAPLQVKIEQQLHNFNNTGNASLTIKDLIEAEIAGEFFASLFPEPLRAKLGIMELLINAIEHGNLEITSEEKLELIKKNIWNEEINYRLTMRKYSHRRVQIYCSKHQLYVEIIIKDEGCGFDWKSHLNLSSDEITRLNGRGITCANYIGFDKLEYIASGYMVKGRQYVQPPTS